MKYFKLFVLQISAIIGLIIGSIIAPGEPIYPFAPSEIHYDLIKYIELNIYLVLGFSSATVSFITSIYLKQTVLTSVYSVLFAGIIFSTLDSLRIGYFYPQIYLLPILAYLFGTLSVYGIVSLFNEATRT